MCSGVEFRRASFPGGVAGGGVVLGGGGGGPGLWVAMVLQGARFAGTAWLHRVRLVALGYGEHNPHDALSIALQDI